MFMPGLEIGDGCTMLVFKTGLPRETLLDMSGSSLEGG
jgi:hypothetical protein